MKAITSLLLLFCIPAVSFAQDAKFSQYENAPLLLSPAYAGKYNENISVSALTSLQDSRGASVNHYTVSADYNLKTPKGAWGLGFNFYRYGHSNYAVSGNFTSVSLARHIAIGKEKKHVLSIGGQMAFARGRGNASRQEYDKGISGGGFSYSPLMAHGTVEQGYTDFNIGGIYTYNTESLVIETGAAVSHLFSPDASLDKTMELKTARKVIFNTRTSFLVNPKNWLHISNLFVRKGLNLRSNNSSNPDCETIYGAMMENNRNGKAALLYGISTRSFNTFMPKLGVRVNKRTSLMLSTEQPFQKNSYDISRTEFSIRSQF